MSKYSTSKTGEGRNDGERRVTPRKPVGCFYHLQGVGGCNPKNPKTTANFKFGTRFSFYFDFFFGIFWVSPLTLSTVKNALCKIISEQSPTYQGFFMVYLLKMLFQYSLKLVMQKATFINSTGLSSTFPIPVVIPATEAPSSSTEI